jgi:hypothetical protein
VSGGGGGMSGTAGVGGSGVVSGSGGSGGVPPLPDDCPADPEKLAPGECGCGVPDVATATLADCQSIKDALIHRYDFEGTGTQVRDRVGNAHGMIARNATLSKLDGKGVVLLGGGDTGAYVDLPNGLISQLTNATLEAWVTWGGGGANQHIFDFGDITDPAPEDKQGSGKSYLFVSSSSNDSTVDATFSSNGTNSSDHVTVEMGPPLPQALSQVVVVTNSVANTLSLYVNGSKLAEQPWTAELSAINDVNVWLGRSQWVNDPELSAVFHDFRIYHQALTGPQIASAFAAGPDPIFLDY